ncbi:hypothetical protein [Bradyrhizobium sp. SZCCHNS3002]|uniref:hypothetical protein n=1 Tax=Bradyrhizobium sp. SZCCHNS3002 TaxID=3057310 RepID=UPI0028E95A93|nr:hypothetical protein [Bradyrhizobium sp. SZCCHNS3002]
MDFPDWLINLGQKLDSIQTSLTECENLAGAELTAAQAFRNTAILIAATTTAAEGRDGHLYACNTLALASLIDLFQLYHDVEMVASWDYVLNKAGVNPDRVIAPISGNIGGGMGYKLEQSGRLSIFPSPGTAGDVVSPGEAGLGVPIDLQILSRNMQARLSISCDIFTANASPAIVALGLGRLPRLSSSETLAPALVFQIEDRAKTEIEGSLARARMITPMLDILPRQPQFWGAYNDGLIRVVGHVGRRSKSRRPFISALPTGFPIALRFDLSIVTNLISQEISSLGVSLFAGPFVTSDKTFRFVAGIRESISLKIGCEVASATVTVRVTVDTSLSVRFGTSLVIEAHPVGTPDIDVDISPRIPFLTHWVEGQIARIVNGFVPSIDGFSRHFFVSGVSNFDVWLSSDHTTFGIVPTA